MRQMFCSIGLIVGGIGWGAIDAGAQGYEPCPVSEGAGDCVRILACWGEAGIWAHGRPYNLPDVSGQGTLIAQRSDDVMCTGTWVARNVFGFGQADVACDDGDTVTVVYVYQDERTGTAIGQGVSASGAIVKAWSGLNVNAYLTQSGVPDGSLACGDTLVPMS